MVHTKECVAAQCVRQKWLDRWPEHCIACRGAGGFTFHETHGLPGPGEQLWEPCVCIEDGRCPRCGKYLLNEESRCFDCGWTLQFGGCPVAECFCEEVL